MDKPMSELDKVDAWWFRRFKTEQSKVSALIKQIERIAVKAMAARDEANTAREAARVLRNKLDRAWTENINLRAENGRLKGKNNE